MFDRIAHRYDLLNRMLSGGRDIVWRKKLATLLPPGDSLEVLDLASGTADVLLAINKTGRIKNGIGLDMSHNMLTIGRDKISARGLQSALSLVRADAGVIPFSENSFDCATMSFGIRNVSDVSTTLREIFRVVRPNGCALILEFSLPSNRILRSLYLFYFRHILPRLGGLISGDSDAYHYLNETVETFPYGEAFCQLMTQSGFEKVTAHPVTFGIATIYRGWKGESS